MCDPRLRPPFRVIDLDTGRNGLLGRLEHFHQGTLPSGNLAASPDGSTIVFRGTVRRGRDLMLVENFY
jgi:hypothetical protein